MKTGAHYHDEQIYTSASWNFASVAFLFATGASRAVVQGRSRGGPENDIGHIVFAVASSAKVRHGALGALFGVDAGGLTRGRKRRRTARARAHETAPA